MSLMSRLSRRFAMTFWLVAACGFAADRFEPQLAGPSEEGQRAIASFRLAEGMTISLAAAEPILAQPVAFCFDEQGALYVAETYRLHRGVEDNRGHMNRLVADLAAQTVEDRLAYYRAAHPDLKPYTEASDRVRKLVDRDGDGVYETSTVFADGFNAPLDGLGSGLLALNGRVYFTCIPHLWMLRDADGDGVAEERQSLHSGFGVRSAFIGHDLHGLTLGPDGKLYFTIGDRGYHVETPGGVLHRPDEGAVFRCEPDGSELEVVNTGLRNPQELAFDDYGNLFTGDNNSDGGDRARWVHLIEGSDSGWRMYYQYLNDRGSWNREKLWHPAHAGQPAYIVPPIVNFADGPSGLVHYPGVGLPQRYQGHFFLADFRGSPANSGIRSFGLNPKGASFELTDTREFAWSILATDVDFGYDGRMYLSDWVDGWGQNGKGRIYRIDVADAPDAAARDAAQKLFATGFETLPTPRLVELLAHPDSRVRQRSQFALVARNEGDELLRRALAAGDVRYRLHGVWGLGQLARTDRGVLSGLLPLLDDPEFWLRTNVAKVLGNAKFTEAGAALIARLQDPEAHVRAQAAIALGKLALPEARDGLLQLLSDVGETDPTLRHAAVVGLAGCVTSAELATWSRHPDSSARRGAVVALRRQRARELTTYLEDADPQVQLEAVRAIHDLPITEGYPAIAALTAQPGLPEETLRRAINANFRLGTSEHAAAVARLAASESAAEAVRLEAVAALNDWNKPIVLDRYLGDYRPLDRAALELAEVLVPALPSLFGGSPSLREQAAQLASTHGLGAAGDFLRRLATATERSPRERVAALEALAALKDERLSELLPTRLEDPSPLVRGAVWKLLASTQPELLLQKLPALKRTGDWRELQAAIDSLVKLASPAADAELGQWLKELATGQVAPELWLELLEAAEARSRPEFTNLVALHRGRLTGTGPARDYAEALHGGHPERGRELFLTRADLSCRRCHKVQGDGGDVGPNLSEIGALKPREYLLEALMDPNRAIAKGYETAVLEMDDGKVHVGIIKQETPERVTLQLPDATLVTVETAAIEERAVGKSGMPEDLAKKLNRRDLRDLVAFLADNKEPDRSAEHGTSAVTEPPKPHVLEPFRDGTLSGWILEHDATVTFVDGVLQFESGNGWLRTPSPYHDFELHLEWRALQTEKYDAGIYIRTPRDGKPFPKDGYQINLLEGREGNIGNLPGASSTGLAKPAGEWNTFDIRVVGNEVSLKINGQPAYTAAGLKHAEGHVGFQIEVPLGGKFQIRDVTLTELDYVSLFNRVDLSGWSGGDGPADQCWSVTDRQLVCSGAKGPWLRSAKTYGDFSLRFDYQLAPGGNSGVYVRVPADGNHHRENETLPVAGFEVQLLDDAAPQYATLKDYQYSASVYDIAGAKPRNSRPAGEWNTLEIRCVGRHVTTIHNGETVVDITAESHPLLKLRETGGYLGLQNHSSVVKFRNVRLREWK